MTTPAAPHAPADPWKELQEGRLLVDVYERPDAMVVRSLVAGVRPECVQISLEGDMLTIRGTREESEKMYNHKVYQQECYWGAFSRTIILPQHVAPKMIRAFFKQGILVIVLPKEQLTTGISVKTESHFLS